MKKILFTLLFVMTCVGINAQKGSHAISVDFKGYNANKIKLKFMNTKDVSYGLGVGYQYGLSDMFKLAPSVHFGIHNGKNAKHELDFDAGLDLQTKILRESDEIAEYDLYAVTGVSYSGLKGCSFESKHIGGKVGLGIQMVFSKHYGFKAEATYNTFEKVDGTIGLVYKF